MAEGIKNTNNWCRFKHTQLLMLSGIELEADCFYWQVCSSDFADTIALNWFGRIFVGVVIARQFEMHR